MLRRVAVGGGLAGCKPGGGVAWDLGPTVLYPATREATCERVLVRHAAEPARHAALREEAQRLSELAAVTGVASWLETGDGYLLYRDPQLLGTVGEYFGEAGESVTVLLNLSDSLLQTLSQLHGRGLVHGAIHLDNLFLTAGHELCWVDAGLLSDQPIGYRCRLEGERVAQDDLYAWGVCMRMVLKGHPWAHHNAQEITELVTRGGRVKMETLPPGIKRHRQELLSFIERLLSGGFESAETARAALLKFHRPKVKRAVVEVLAERNITVTGLIGQGGMGAVYRGIDKSQNHAVAIKVMLDVPAEIREEMAARFQSEAQTLGRLRHAGVVGFRSLLTYEVEDEDEEERSDRQVMVLEYVPGVPLDLWFELSGRNLERLGPVVEQLLEALGYLHQQRLVHRDLKPDNILVGPDDRVKLLDFGVVKNPERRLTQAGEGLGTPEYWAPEQLTDVDKVDARTDLYTLGLVLIKLCCGSGKFVHDAQMQNGETVFLGGSLFEGREEGRVAPGPFPAMLMAFLQRLVVREMVARYESSAMALQVWRRLVAAGALREALSPRTARVGEHNRTPSLRQGWTTPVGPPRMGVLYGLPGVGKTRLLREHAGWVLAESLGDVWWADSLEALRSRLGGVSLDTLPGALEAAAKELQPSLLVPNPRLLVCVDDNGAEADEDTISFLNGVAALKSARLVVVGTARSRTLPSADGTRTQVLIPPLTGFECTEMARAALAAKEVAEPLAAGLYAQTAGIPRLLEMLLAALEENVHYVRFPDRQAVALKPFSHFPMPAEAEPLLLALTADQEPLIVRLLSGLGVIGEDIDRSLYRLWGTHCGQTEKSLFTSTGRSAVVRDSTVLTASADKSTYSFSPRMLASAAATLCTADDRKAAHELGLAHIEKRMDPLLSNVHDHCAEVVALCRERVRHLQGLGRIDDAVHWCIEGADLASFLGDWTQGEAWLTYALSVQTEACPRRARAVALLATLLNSVGRRHEAVRLAEEAKELTDLLQEDTTEREVLSLLPAVYLDANQVANALQLVSRFLPLAARATPRQRVRSGVRLGHLYYAGCTEVSFAEALGALSEALEVAGSCEVPREMCSILYNMRGACSLKGSKVDQAEADFTLGALDRHARRGERSWAFNNLGLLHWKRHLAGSLAISHYRDAIEAARSESLPERLWPAYNNIGYLTGLLGHRMDDALAAFEAAEQSLPPLANPFSRASIQLARAETVLLYGDHDVAVADLRDVLDLVGAGLPELSLYARRRLLLIELANAKTQDANNGKYLERHNELAEEARSLEVLARRSSNPDHLWAALSCRLYAAVGWRSGGGGTVTEVIDELRRIFPLTTLRAEQTYGLRDAELAEAEACAALAATDISSFRTHIEAVVAHIRGTGFLGLLGECARRISILALRLQAPEDVQAALRLLLQSGIDATNVSGAKKERQHLEVILKSLAVGVA